jgi:hypothetical protein
MALATTYGEARDHFCDGHAAAARTLQAWREDASKREVVPHVEQARTAALYALTSEELAGVIARTMHPLGDIKREVRERVPSVRDWHPAFSFQHVLHHSLEATGKVLTYQDFREFCRDDARARQMLLEPAAAITGHAQEADRVTFSEARDALRWRVGLAYYSFLRELFVIISLREAGLDARCHVLADCLFRVDFWVRGDCFELFVTSPQFKGGQAGRKHGPAHYIGPSARLRFHRLELPVQHRHGVAHLPRAADAVEAVRRLAPGGSAQAGTRSAQT